MAGDEPSEGTDPGADATDEEGVGDESSEPAADGSSDSGPRGGETGEEPQAGAPETGEPSDDVAADDAGPEGGGDAESSDGSEDGETDAGGETGPGDEADVEDGHDGPGDEGNDADGAGPEPAPADEGRHVEGEPGGGAADDATTDDEETAASETAESDDEEPESDDGNVDVGDSDDEGADEQPPMAPEGEADPAVDPPVPADLEAGAAEDVSTAAVGTDTVDDVDASVDHAGPVVEDADEGGGGIFGTDRPGPTEDREMPLAEHIREMLKRLAVVVAVAGVVSILVFPFSERVINFLWYSILPGVESEIARPRLYGVLELLFTELKVASLAGLIVALPVLVYETYAFMRPGLYPHERRYYLAAVPTSLVLAIVGVAFAYFVVLPAIFVYFLYYSQDVATIGFALGRTFDLVLLMMGYLAVVFQIPLFLMLAMMMGLVTRRWLAERRLLFWGAFLGLSFFFGFDPTGMAPIIVAATMIALFEGTLLLTKWTGRE